MPRRRANSRRLIPCVSRRARSRRPTLSSTEDGRARREGFAEAPLAMGADSTASRSALLDGLPLSRALRRRARSGRKNRSDRPRPVGLEARLVTRRRLWHLGLDPANRLLAAVREGVHAP